MTPATLPPVDVQDPATRHTRAIALESIRRAIQRSAARRAAAVIIATGGEQDVDEARVDVEMAAGNRRVARALASYAAAAEQHLAGCRYRHARLAPGALEDHLEGVLEDAWQATRIALAEQLGADVDRTLEALVPATPTWTPQPTVATTPEPTPPGRLARAVGWLTRRGRTP